MSDPFQQSQTPAGGHQGQQQQTQQQQQGSGNQLLQLAPQHQPPITQDMLTLLCQQGAHAANHQFGEQKQNEDHQQMRAAAIRQAQDQYVMLQLQQQQQQQQQVQHIAQLRQYTITNQQISQGQQHQPLNLSASAAPPPTSAETADTTEIPGNHDVLLGRGGETNNHGGNIKFRQLVLEYRDAYREASKIEKPAVARRLVAHWRNLNPRGRFLAKTGGPNSALWTDVGDKNAQKRASKSLGERDKPSKRASSSVVASAPGPSTAASVVACTVAAGKVSPTAALLPGAALFPASNKRLRSSSTGWAEEPKHALARSTAVPQQESESGLESTPADSQTPTKAVFMSINDQSNQGNNEAKVSSSPNLQQMIPAAADLVSDIFSGSDDVSSSSSAPDLSASASLQPPSSPSDPPFFQGPSAEV